MFSEYASKFLAQSQSRISFVSTQDNASKHPRSTVNFHQAKSRVYSANKGHRQHGTGLGPFSFGSKVSPHAPLFQSFTNDTATIEDEEEHEREVADYFALQRSRKHFVQGTLEDSSEVEDYHESHSDRLVSQLGRYWRYQNDHGIESSWHGDNNKQHKRQAPYNEQRDGPDSPLIGQENLTDTLKSIDLNMDENQINAGGSTTGPSIAFGSCQDAGSGTQWDEPVRSPNNHPSFTGSKLSAKLPQQSNEDHGAAIFHDHVWGKIYLVTIICFFASFVLVWLHVSTPIAGRPAGDTIYTTIQHSRYLLVMDTIVAVFASIAWLIILRSYTRPLIYCLMVALPITLTSFSLYPFISTFRNSSEASPTIQDKIVRLFSIIPLLIGGVWIFGVFRSRKAFGRAIDLLELSVKILTANPPLVLVGFAILAFTVIWSWLWIAIIARVFLGGRFTSSMTFMVNTSTWWLGAFYIFVYLWTMNVVAGIQRSTTGAAVSQWYFHRRNIPTVPSSAVARAALSHSLTFCFGTICLSTLVALLMRLPALFLPRRLMACTGIISTTLIPDNIIIVTDPLTLTHAAIHNHALAEATRAVQRFSVFNRIDGLGSRSYGSLRLSGNRPHRLALFLLYASRLAATFAFGFGAWIHAAHFHYSTDTTGGYTGSMYAYFVGLIAGGIGWAVIGAMESVLTGIVDAIVVCWESEIASGSPTRYCKEAEWILSDGGESGYNSRDNNARPGL